MISESTKTVLAQFPLFAALPEPDRNRIAAMMGYQIKQRYSFI